MYEKTVEFLYNMISIRVKNARKNLGLKGKDVLIDETPDGANLISAIEHNRKNPKKNRYLIPTTYISIIQEKLQFHSICHLLFGTEKEILSYSGKLFEIMILESLEQDTPFKNLIMEALTEDSAFAINRFITEFVNEHGTFLANLYIDNRILNKYSDYDTILIQAIAYLYNNQDIKYVYEDALIDFFRNLDSTIKLNKRIKEFVENTLIPIITRDANYKQIYDIGNKIYNELSNTYNESFVREIDSYDIDRAHLPELENYKTEIINEILTVTINYVLELSNIQYTTFPVPAIENEWSPELINS